MRIIRYVDERGQVGYAAEQPDRTVKRIEGDLFGQWKVTDECVGVRKLLAPVEPAAIFAIGLNYRQHAAETHAAIPDFPVLFMKNVAAVQNPGDPILIPRLLRSDEVDYECELVVVIGRRCKNVSRSEALQYVLGYTCGNDVTARDWQKRRSGGQWCRAKSFDTFAPLGPCIVTPDEIPNPNCLEIRTLVNGEVLQQTNTADMIFDVPSLIEFLSGSTTLLPGTVIFTGTPGGVGMARTPPRYLEVGDVVTVEIEKIGALTNPVGLEEVGVHV
ncbi:MAG: fumarylacetoacetate hydrolase family protein [Verrucomicrobiae bacterium]|nr:fumarylacetoacetate hydrolase family protein [Verrucomicrobiae bacterium]